MPLKSVAIPAAAFLPLVFVQVAVAAPPNDACNPPEDLQREVATKYPGARIVSLSDLQEDDKGFFQKDHGEACPGLVKVDFYGDGKLTLALVLTRKAGANEHTELVVAHHVGAKWKMAVLGTGGPSPYAPVVWSQPPGEYRDVYGSKTIRATRPVIVFCKYESWEILYAWTRSGVTKIWLRD